MESSPKHPETIEGWYALHQIFSLDREGIRALGQPRRQGLAAAADRCFEGMQDLGAGGWSVLVGLIGSTSDVMIIHFREGLDALGEAQRTVDHLELRDLVTPTYSFLSITEAGLYQVTATVAKETLEQGGRIGDESYRHALEEKVEAQRRSEHVRRRIYPERPAAMPYVSFYPMDKRREVGQNWYTLKLDERNALMHEHGVTGRRYAGRVQQVITGAIGFDQWEWGVTLFAGDPLDFKKLVTEMRFDEASAKYAEFGQFYTGKVSTAAAILG